jgi:hypothetical protein
MSASRSTCECGHPWFDHDRRGCGVDSFLTGPCPCTLSDDPSDDLERINEAAKRIPPEVDVLAALYRTADMDDRRPYATPGGFYIGDDVEVHMPDGRVEKARVQGPEGPFVRVMLASGHGYIAAEDMLTRVARPTHTTLHKKGVPLRTPKRRAA